MEYTTPVPFCISCPLCKDLHQTREQMAECWIERAFNWKENIPNYPVSVQGGK